MKRQRPLHWREHALRGALAGPDLSPFAIAIFVLLIVAWAAL